VFFVGDIGKLVSQLRFVELLVVGSCGATTDRLFFGFVMYQPRRGSLRQMDWNLRRLIFHIELPGNFLTKACEVSFRIKNLTYFLPGFSVSIERREKVSHFRP